MFLKATDSTPDPEFQKFIPNIKFSERVWENNSLKNFKLTVYHSEQYLLKVVGLPGSSQATT